MDSDGNNQVNLTRNPADDSSPVWSPDEKKISFASNRDGNFEIYVMNADGSNQKRLTNNKANDMPLAWSPDGKYIAILSNRDDVIVDSNRGITKSEIYIMNVDGSNQMRLTNDLDLYHTISWSPDGKSFVICSTPRAASGAYYFDEIYISLVSRKEILTQSTSNNCDPDWSPDGKHVAFVSNRDGQSNIYIMNIDGTDQSALTDDSSYNIDPSWARNGQYIVFASRRDGNYDIYVMNTDGTKIIQLTNDPADDYMPTWSPVQ